MANMKIMKRMDGEHILSNLRHNFDAPHSVDNLRLRLSHAVNTLRCLTIPKCYPTIRCLDDEAPMQIPIDNNWERQAFCVSDLKKISNNGDSKCLVYSFGINDNTELKEKMNEEFGCDVIAFDPTSDLPMNIAPGVTFHQLGLQGDGVDVSETHSDQYDALDPTKLLTLGQIVKHMGHTGRKIDILRLDCEGCEWGVLKQLACSKSTCGTTYGRNAFSEESWYCNRRRYLDCSRCYYVS